MARPNHATSQDESMQAYIALAHKALSCGKLLWPSRPKHHAPRYSIIHCFYFASTYLVPIYVQYIYDIYIYYDIMLIYIYIKIQLFFTSAVLWDMGPFFSVSGTDVKYMFKL